MLNRIVTAFVLCTLLISAPTFAAPDGSLRKMLDTKITLIEYITLYTKLTSVEREARGRTREWGDYSSVVRLRVDFDYEDSELAFTLTPVEDHNFSTVAEAKPYCRDLIRAERLSVWALLFFNSEPNGWSTGSLDSDDFNEKLLKSSKIRTYIGKGQIEEELPEGEYSLACTASLDEDGQIKNFSYNL